MLADIFVLADDYQYTTHGQINRTRIKMAGGPGWLTVPVRTRGRRGQAIKDIRIDNSYRWREKHRRSIEVSYAHAAYLEKYDDRLAQIFSQEYKYLLDVNLTSIAVAIDALNIDVRIRASSELAVEGRADGKLVNMMLQLGCSRYLADASLKSYLNRNVFAANGLDLRFLEPPDFPYHQLFEGHVSNLSIIDLLLNEGPEGNNLLAASVKNHK